MRASHLAAVASASGGVGTILRACSKQDGVKTATSYLAAIPRAPARVEVADGGHAAAVHLLVAVAVHREAAAAACAHAGHVMEAMPMVTTRYANERMLLGQVAASASEQVMSERSLAKQGVSSVL